MNSAVQLHAVFRLISVIYLVDPVRLNICGFNTLNLLNVSKRTNDKITYLCV